MSQEFDGFQDLMSDLEEMMANASNVQDVLEVGAKEYVGDIEKLGKPYSQIKKSGYTHLLNSMGTKRAKENEIEVGSTTEYYLRFVNDGSKASSKRKWSTPRQPFLNTTYERNKNKYNKLMLKELSMER